MIASSRYDVLFFVVFLHRLLKWERFKWTKHIINQINNRRYIAELDL